jgi:hypothetical protein
MPELCRRRELRIYLRIRLRLHVHVGVGAGVGVRFGICVHAKGCAGARAWAVASVIALGSALVLFFSLWPVHQRLCAAVLLRVHVRTQWLVLRQLPPLLLLVVLLLGVYGAGWVAHPRRLISTLLLLLLLLQQVPLRLVAGDSVGSRCCCRS